MWAQLLITPIGGKLTIIHRVEVFFLWTGCSDTWICLTLGYDRGNFQKQENQQIWNLFGAFVVCLCVVLYFKKIILIKKQLIAENWNFTHNFEVFTYILKKIDQLSMFITTKWGILKTS